ncbi:MAG: PIN domain-containing protein [Candidatus Lokiarchaeota archaeon]|nr:PIN domain-containing protein [Candidatus Lokiarchaeota archaeon]MBD3342857.1 PIN domain-containing protein [Candidatus Lokiarchaeota archaeon]
MEKERNILEENKIAIDTGVFIEYIEKTRYGKKFKNSVLMDPGINEYHISPLVETELNYLFCRKWGDKQGFLMVKKMLTGYSIQSESYLREEASRFKCKYPISLSDCYSLSVAKLKTIPIYFKMEEELDTNFDALSEEVEIRFIDFL